MSVWTHITVNPFNLSWVTVDLRYVLSNRGLLSVQGDNDLVHGSLWFALRSCTYWAANERLHQKGARLDQMTRICQKQYRIYRSHLRHEAHYRLTTATFWGSDAANHAFVLIENSLETYNSHHLSNISWVLLGCPGNNARQKKLIFF